MLRNLKKVDKVIEWIFVVFCAVLLFSMLWLTFFMVFFRYVLNNSIIWAEEALRYMMVWLVLVGAGLTFRADQHVCIDVMQSILGRWPKAQAVHYVITRLVVVAFLIWLMPPSLELMEKMSNVTATAMTWLPKSAVYCAMPVGIVSMILGIASIVPKRAYDIWHGIEDDELVLELQAKAEEMEEELQEFELEQSEQKAIGENEPVEIVTEASPDKGGEQE